MGFYFSQKVFNLTLFRVSWDVHFDQVSLVAKETGLVSFRFRRERERVRDREEKRNIGWKYTDGKREIKERKNQRHDWREKGRRRQRNAAFRLPPRNGFSNQLLKIINCFLEREKEPMGNCGKTKKNAQGDGKEKEEKRESLEKTSRNYPSLTWSIYIVNRYLFGYWLLWTKKKIKEKVFLNF